MSFSIFGLCLHMNRLLTRILSPSPSKPSFSLPLQLLHALDVDRFQNGKVFLGFAWIIGITCVVEAKDPFWIDYYKLLCSRSCNDVISENT